MQRTAQDRLVLTELTHHDATAVGIVMALQFGPQAMLLPVTGYAADRFDRRRLLMATQGAMGLLAVGLGLLTVLHRVQLWHVYVFALLLGIASAFDIPVRHTFVSDMVPAEDMANAVALNSASFNAARLVGPAMAGLVIAVVGTGWALLANGLSFAGVLLSLVFLRTAEIRLRPPRAGAGVRFIEGVRGIAGRPDLRAIVLMYFLIGTFGMNYPIFISTMAVTVFHKGAGQFGILTVQISAAPSDFWRICAVGGNGGQTLSSTCSGMAAVLLRTENPGWHQIVYKQGRPNAIGIDHGAALAIWEEFWIDEGGFLCSINEPGSPGARP